jgi:methionine aminopeptidase
MTYEEVVEHIRAFPGSLAGHERGTDEGAVADVAAAAMDEVAVAAKLARATQESLKMRVEIARGRGATWTMIGKAIGVTAWRAEQRYFEKRPFGARW